MKRCNKEGSGVYLVVIRLIALNNRQFVKRRPGVPCRLIHMAVAVRKKEEGLPMTNGSIVGCY